MKTSILLAACLAACAAEEPELQVESQDLNGDSWATTDDNDYNGHGAGYTGLAFQETYDNVIVVGSRNEPAGFGTWIVRSAVRGGTFSLADAFRLAPGQTSFARRVVVSGPNVYVSGVAEDASGGWHLITRRAQLLAHDFSSWSIVDDVAAPAGQQVDVLGMAMSTSGEVFVAAQVGTSKIIRHGSQSSWSYVPLPSGLGLEGICTNGTALIATGYTQLLGGGTSWSVWSWGGLWANIDSFSPPGASTMASACVASDTTLFVGGGIGTPGDPAGNQWLVRSRPLSGGAWTSIDTSPSPYFGAPFQMIVGRLGRIYEVGQRGVTSSSVDWLVRRSGPSGWLDSDVVDGTGSPPFATGFGLAYDSRHGGTYAAGVIEDASGVQHGLVRESD